MTRKPFTTFEIVLMALLAVANGVLTTYTAFINQMLTAAGGPILTSTITGIYMIYGLLAVYIIRKPGTAIITYLFGAIMQSLLGNSYGMLSAFVAAVCYAVVAEVLFYLYRYNKWGYGPMALAGACMVPIWFFFAAYLYGYLKWGIPVLAAALIVRTLSGVVLCGLITKWLGDQLAKTGLLRSFALGKR
jgi:energy-coupling factor transport system substrate-specific component